MKPVRVDPEARDEIRDAARWYEARRAGLGTDLISAVDVAIGRASILGPECRPAPQLPVDLGVRRVLCERFPYVVFFVELPAVVRVIAVGHERRRPGYFLPRVR